MKYLFYTSPESKIAKQTALAKLNAVAVESYEKSRVARIAQSNAFVNNLQYSSAIGVIDAQAVMESTLFDAINQAANFWTQISGTDVLWANYILECLNHFITRTNADSLSARDNANPSSTALPFFGNF